MSNESPPVVDLEAYLSRIRYSGDLSPTLAVLEELHLAHALHIPFENLDVLLGQPIRLDLPGLQAKLVKAQRGGYCFEQNLLFAAVLERCGFALTRLAARVRLGATRLLPRTHMAIKVDTEHGSWLADVGFGGEGLFRPVPLVSGQAVRHFGWTSRVIEEGGLWVLQSHFADGWHDLYAFTLEPQLVVDYEVANYYVSTHPESIFTRMLTVQRPTPESRYILRNDEFIVMSVEGETRRTIEEAELVPLLAETFGLVLPAGTPLRIPKKKEG
jgi:N-hydroxyarylamine O-acetyltransferase